MDLQKALAGKTLTLTGGSNGRVSFTLMEVVAAALLLQALLPSFDVEVPKPLTDEVDGLEEELEKAIASTDRVELKPEYIVRKTLTGMAEREDADKADFPKVRDYASYNWIGRAALEKLGITDTKVKDTLFPVWRAKKKVA